MMKSHSRNFTQEIVAREVCIQLARASVPFTCDVVPSTKGSVFLWEITVKIEDRSKLNVLAHQAAKKANNTPIKFVK